MPTLQRELSALTAREHDLVIVGGGIFGVCAAWEAASRGLSVALVEKGDFAGATSANSYKIAHGGIRYLQHADLWRVRASSAERSALLRVAPHLVRPLPILIPTYGHGVRGKGLLRAGFLVYDALTWDRNRGIPDPERRIPRARSMGRTEVLDRFPDLPAGDLTGGVLFCDGQMYSPPRLALSFLRSAVGARAAVANYVEVNGFLREGSRILGVRCRDRLDGRILDIRARFTLNAAGPWAPRLLQDDLSLRLGDRTPTFSRDVGLVTRRSLSGEVGLACSTETRDAEAVLDRGGRHLFLLPWRGRTLVGVWHGVHREGADRVEVSERELEAFCGEANRAYPGLRLTVDDVTTVNTGLILYGDDDEGGRAHSFGKRSLIVDHEREHGLRGLVTVLGVRATMARGVSERAVDLLARRMARPVACSRTWSTPVFGGDIGRFEDLVSVVEEEVRAVVGRPDPPVARALAHNHGSRFGDVLSLAREHPELADPLPDTQVLRAEVLHAVQAEMALTLEDVVLRRTDLGTAGSPGRDALESSARVMAEALCWSRDREREEVRRLEAYFEHRGAVRAYSAVASPTAGEHPHGPARAPDPEGQPAT